MTNVGASLMEVMVMRNVWGGGVTPPPLAVPPLSWRVTVTVTLPFSSGAGVKLSVPVGLSEGCTEKRLGLVFVNVKVKTWLDSFAGPGEMEVAQLLTIRAPESSFTV